MQPACGSNGAILRAGHLSYKFCCGQESEDRQGPREALGAYNVIGHMENIIALGRPAQGVSWIYNKAWATLCL